MKHAPTALAALTALAILTILSLPLIGRAQDDAADAVDLRLRLQPGDTYKLTMTTDKTINEWIQNLESISTSTTAMWLTMDVIAVDDDGTARVKLTFDRVATTSDEEDDVSEYDSENPDEDLEFPLKIYQALVGQSFEVKLSPAGEVVKVLNADALQLAMATALSGGRSTFTIKTSSTKGMASALFGTSLRLDPIMLMDKKGLRRLAASLVFVRPGEPVATGHTWERDNDLPVDSAMNCDSTYKLASHQDGVAMVEIEGTLEHDPGSRSGKPVITFANTTTSMEGTRSGVLKLDEESGVVTSARITDTIKGETKPTEDADEDEPEGNPPITFLAAVDIVTTITCEKQP